eukprot:PhM_4_TR7591/c0_g1_i1/m.83151
MSYNKPYKSHHHHYNNHHHHQYPTNNGPSRPLGIKLVGGNIYLVGDYITSCAATLLASAPGRAHICPDDVARQQRRDWKSYHVTLVHKNDLPPNCDIRDVAAAFEDAVVNPVDDCPSPVCLGLGRATGPAKVCYFGVIAWPHGNNLRLHFGMEPKDFHVTVGFGQSGDVHNVPKGPQALLVHTMPVPWYGTAEELVAVAKLGLRLSSDAQCGEAAYDILSAVLAHTQLERHRTARVTALTGKCYLARSVAQARASELDDAWALLRLEPCAVSCIRAGDACARAHFLRGAVSCYWVALALGPPRPVEAEHCVKAISGCWKRLHAHPDDGSESENSYSIFLGIFATEALSWMYGQHTAKDNAMPPLPVPPIDTVFAAQHGSLPSVLKAVTKLYEARALVSVDHGAARPCSRDVLLATSATHTLPGYRWVVPGVVLAAHVPPRDAADLHAMHEALGVRASVSLAQGHVDPSHDGVVSYVVGTDTELGPFPDHVEAFVNIVSSHCKNGVVVVHSSHWPTAVTLAVCYLVRCGVAPPPADVGTSFSPALSPAEALGLLAVSGTDMPQSHGTAIDSYASYLWGLVGNPPPAEPDQSVVSLTTVTARAVNVAPVPTIVVLVGSPGSGKSYIADKLVNTSGFLRVCQDECGGSRRDTESAFVHAVKRGSVVLDRCNPTAEERRQWLALAFRPDPAKTACVYFDVPKAVCLRRANRRLGHPTIGIGRACRPVDHFYGLVEAPTCAEGFGAVHTVRTTADVDALFAQWGMSQK